GTLFFFSSRRRHTRCLSDWSSDVCSSDLTEKRLWSVEWLRRTAVHPAGRRRREDEAAGGVAAVVSVPAEWGAPGRSGRSARWHRSEERRVGKVGKWWWWTGDCTGRRLVQS